MIRRATIVRFEPVLFFLAVLLNLLPVLVFTYLPQQDGPAHLHNAMVLTEYGRSPVLREYYTVGWSFAGNAVGHVMLVALMAILPPVVAGNVILGLLVVGLPLALRWALAQVAPGGQHLAWVALPLCYHRLFFSGFWNFCLGMCLLCLLVGVAVRWSGRWTVARAAVAGLLALTLYFTHLIPWALGLGAAVFISLAPVVVAAWRQGGWAALPSALRTRQVLLPLIAVLPGVVPVGLYVGGKMLDRNAGVRAHVAAPEPPPDETSAPRPTGNLRGPVYALHQVVTLEVLQSLTELEAPVANALAIGLLGCAAYIVATRRRRAPSLLENTLLLLVGGTLVLAMIVPDKLGAGTVLKARVVLCWVLFLLFWLASAADRTLVRAGLAGLGLLAAVGLHAVRWPLYGAIDRQLSEVAALQRHIEPESTLLTFVFAKHGLGVEGRRLAQYISPFQHVSGLVTSARPVVDLANYEANTDHFLVAYRPELSPYRHIGTETVHQATPPWGDFAGYPKRTKGRVDYVLLVAPYQADAAHPSVRSVREQLEQGYEVVAASDTEGLAILCRRRGQSR